MIKLLILGPTGSMGRLISKLAFTDDEIEIVAACDINSIGTKLGALVGVEDPKKIIIRDVNILQEVIEDTQPDIAIDFTVAKATERNCLICAENGIKCVIGTTALSKEFLVKFENLVKENNAPAVISSNMATGVNILFKLASILTQYLKDWDIEILETHHHRKLDAPSGTALTIANVICDALERDPNEILKFGRSKGPNKRKIGAKNEIGVHAIRAGDIVGDHVILYAGPGERIEIKHQAHSRSSFAEGAIKALKFLNMTKENKIFSTGEVLGF